jgi:hypothetical protein
LWQSDERVKKYSATEAPPVRISRSHLGHREALQFEPAHKNICQETMSMIEKVDAKQKIPPGPRIACE